VLVFACVPRGKRTRTPREAQRRDALEDALRALKPFRHDDCELRRVSPQRRNHAPAHSVGDAVRSAARPTVHEQLARNHPKPEPPPTTDSRHFADVRLSRCNRM
jgi:hypothetical protein